jgi:hypothetical protein
MMTNPNREPRQGTVTVATGFVITKDHIIIGSDSTITGFEDIVDA